jgi:hypothetical protein
LVVSYERDVHPNQNPPDCIGRSCASNFSVIEAPGESRKEEEEEVPYGENVKRGPVLCLTSPEEER